jgi:hypothetical protein
MGIKDPRITLEWIPGYVAGSGTPFTDATAFIRNYQAGAQIATLHYLVKKGPAAIGLTFSNARADRVTLSCRAGDVLRATAEFFGENVTVVDAACPWGGVEVNKAVAWPYVSLLVATKAAPTTVAENTKWHEWRYEVRNNLERLANVNTKGTRSLEVKQRRVSGTLVWDFENFNEYTEYIGVDADKLFALQVKDDEGNYLLGQAGWANAQWGRLEVPHGPEDLQLKRFPFTSLNLTQE